MTSGTTVFEHGHLVSLSLLFHQETRADSSGLGLEAPPDSKDSSPLGSCRTLGFSCSWAVSMMVRLLLWVFNFRCGTVFQDSLFNFDSPKHFNVVTMKGYSFRMKEFCNNSNSHMLPAASFLFSVSSVLLQPLFYILRVGLGN